MLIVFATKKCAKTFKAIQRTFHLENIRTIRKLSRLSGNFPGIRKLSRLSGNFPGYPETFWTLRKISGIFPGYPETFWTIWKISRLSGNFPDHPEIFQTVWKLPSAISRVTRKNFPDAQKLSGWQCHDATMVFVPLGNAEGRRAGERGERWFQWKRSSNLLGQDRSFVPNFLPFLLRNILRVFSFTIYIIQ